MLNTDFSYDLTEGTLSRYIVEGDGYSRDICYSYDGFGRTSSVTRSLTEFDGTGSIGQNIAYGYIQTSDPDDGTITYNRIGSVTNEYTVTADDETTTVASETFTYTYDASGNITEIKNNGSTLFRYHYDLLDQLTREDNAQSGRTYVYEYDNAGNIKSKKTYGYTTSATVSTTLYSTQTYGYGSGISGDILTSLNGSSITYDGTLSPLNYVLSGDDCALTWTQGRRLSHIISDDGSREYSYTYNADGIRTSKTVNGVEHIYHLSGTRILDEEWVSGSTRNLLIYIYDASGQPIGINYLKCVGNTVTKEAYLLGTNIQGDITCIYDTAGNRVVTYTYDAWGKILSVTGTAANTIGRYNPFRYRGYYYDNETGFYYLNSRYYDPSVGRFLNADGIDFLGTDEGLLSYNLFAYCLNDPVNRTDDSGNLSIKNWIKIGVGAIALGAAIALTVATGGGAAAVAIGVAKVVGSVALSTAVSAGAGYLKNGKQGAIDGACNGFMLGSLSALGGAAFKYAKVHSATTGSPNSMGKAGERMAGIDQSAKEPIQINGRTRIPDAMTDTTLIEVKNVKYISNTQQLRDFAAFANATGRSLELWVRPTTRIAKTVIDAGWHINYLW